MKDVTVPTSICLGCGSKLDAVISAFGNDTPSPGDITVCLACGKMMAFTRTLRLRALTKAEQHTVERDARIAAVEIKRREAMQKVKH